MVGNMALELWGEPGLDFSIWQLLAIRRTYGIVQKKPDGFLPRSGQIV